MANSARMLSPCFIVGLRLPIRLRLRIRP